MGLFLILVILVFPETVPVSDDTMLDVIGEVSRDGRKVFIYAGQESA